MPLYDEAEGQHGPTKKWVKREDPLDSIVKNFFFLMGAAIVGCYIGWYDTIITFLIAAFGLAYINAPARSYPTAEAISKGKDLTGKVAFVTGVTSGIGKETARVLALRGAHVILASRNVKKLNATKADLEKSLAKAGKTAKFDIVQLDLGDLDSVRAAAAKFKAMGLGLHLLINNAGIMALPERTPTKQKFEAQVGTNHLGHFLLTNLLLPELEASAPSRVVVLSSMAYGYRHPEFPYNTQLETVPYSPWEAYGNSKVCNMMFAKELHRRYSAKGITSASLHPGGIHTGLQPYVSLWTAVKWRVMTPLFFKSIAQGAGTTLYAALKEDVGGHFFNDCKCHPEVDAKYAPEDKCKEVWELTEALVQ